jgi:hypothetical protein
MAGPLHEDLCIYVTYREIILVMNNVSDKGCRRKQNTFFFAYNNFFPENRSVHEIMWKNIVMSSTA